jgi:hypothetical protein
MKQIRGVDHPVKVKLYIKCYGVNQNYLEKVLRLWKNMSNQLDLSYKLDATPPAIVNRIDRVNMEARRDIR